MQSRKQVMSLMLWAVAQTAMANVQATQAQAHPQPQPQPVPTAAVQKATARAAPGAASVPAAQRAGDMLIRSADAGPMQPHPQAQARPTPADHEERKPRTSTTMLLTALAVMCAIVLRRIGNGPR